MNLSAPFIHRPVMTTLVMAALVVFGVLGYTRLAVSELPAVDFPVISITATLPGADPETMASAVATPLENQLSSIAGIDSMTSTSTLGSTTVTIAFNLDRDIDAAAQDVQSALTIAQRKLPTAMTTAPAFRKVNPSESPIFYVALSSATLPLSEVNQYAESQLARQLSTVDGVADVAIYGSQKFALRLQMDPDALAARGIGIDEASSAAQAANVNQASGTLYGTKKVLPIRTDGQLMTATDFARQVVVYRDGAPVRFGDVGQVVNSVASTQVASWLNGTRAIILAIRRQPGSNTIAVVDRLREVLPQFEKNTPPSISMSILYDRSQTIRASVEDVEFSLMLAAVLVVMVIFLFLRNLSATLIPSVALPITVVATFAGMAMLGYSLDNLSLMALTLSVGFVVDDAIVMLENIVRHLENGETPWNAALKGAREVGFTILSMTLSLAAVFIPVVFMGGLLGRLLHEMAMTLILAIAISGVVSITLTPMLCSRLLRSHALGAEQHGALFRWSERIFEAVQEGYAQSLRWSMTHHRVTFSLFLLSLAATVLLFQAVPKDFLPSDDTGQLVVNTEAQIGTSFTAMKDYQKTLAEIAATHPDVAAVMSSVGAGGSRPGSNSGLIFLPLKPFAEREKTADQILAELRRKMSGIPGINAYIVNPPMIRIGATSSKASYQYTLQGLNLSELQSVSTHMMQEMSASKGFADVNSDLDLSAPALSVQIDRERAAALGVTPAQIQNALAASFGGLQISTLYTSIDQYNVMIELKPEFQDDPAALSRLYLRGMDGTLVPLSAVVSSKMSSMAQAINHQGQLPAVTVSFNLTEGTALSDAVEKIAQIEQKIAIPPTVQSSLQGTAQAFKSSTAGMGWLLALSIVVVYITLGILYESFIHPLTILSGLPSAAVGALLTLLLLGMPLSLYGFVGIIMLIGIVKKNAIMMVDFALVEQRQHGLSAAEAIYQASLVRFRPIMMTTLAALMGTLPIALAIGAGGAARQPLGVTVVGGLMVSQILTLYITPVLYVMLDRLAGKRGFSEVPNGEELDNAPRVL